MAVNPIDLCAVADVKSYLQVQAGVNNVNASAASYDDALIQGLITGLSQHWLTQTGRNTLNSEETVTSECYDGNGSVRLFLDNYPILSVSQLLINNVTVGPSITLGQFGYFIERSGKSIAIRQGGYAGVTSPGFWGVARVFVTGIGNVFVTYEAGYDGVPSDINEAAVWQVAQAYTKREHLELKSLNMGGGAGSTTYQDWEWSSDVQRVLKSYKRMAVGNTT
jgi:hypothetical protein